MSSDLEAWLASLPERADAHLRQTGRPLVTLSYAQSLDGCISTQRGQPFAISGPAALHLTHRLRALHTAILVGIGTVLADDPQLSVRMATGRSPRPVVLDARLRFPLTARLLQRGDNLPWLFCDPFANEARSQVLQQHGVQVMPVDCDGEGHLNLEQVLNKLGQAGIALLMVEGGARVISHFLVGQWVDAVVITTAPIWLGGLHAFEASSHGEQAFPALANAGYTTFGADLVTWGDVQPYPNPNTGAS